jgi:hypothetical protein
MSLKISKGLTLRKGWQPMDPDAAAYITAVETADGQALEEKTKIAIDNFVLGCKADGIWNAIKASCILAGARTLNGALVPLVGTAPTQLGTAEGWNYNRKTGTQGNGTDNALDSGRANNAEPQNSKHVSMYITAVSGSGIMFYSAADVGGGNTSGDNAAGGRYSANGTATSGAPGLPANNTLLGVSRFSSSQMSLRLNKITRQYSLSSSPPNASTILFHVRRNASTGALESFRNDRIAFYSIGESLNLALLDARVTDLINAFAAAIP